ncbi:hypothetical protein OHC33_009802 [Knufia fluminis]|uniref:Uncharacterized protein n=1 Tax=Knufia fluminis TaxID=191047 RepID=A0AAN8EL71_9EURO|nr:hypothetical protein OHC33_009802 [Knufia fluminis]
MPYDKGFLDLPAEVREMIYRYYVLGGQSKFRFATRCIHNQRISPVTGNDDNSNRDPKPFDQDLKPENIPICQICERDRDLCLIGKEDQSKRFLYDEENDGALRPWSAGHHPNVLTKQSNCALLMTCRTCYLEAIDMYKAAHTTVEYYGSDFTLILRYQATSFLENIRHLTLHTNDFIQQYQYVKHGRAASVPFHAKQYESAWEQMRRLPFDKLLTLTIDTRRDVSYMRDWPLEAEDMREWLLYLESIPHRHRMTPYKLQKMIGQSFPQAKVWWKFYLSWGAVVDSNLPRRVRAPGLKTFACRIHEDDVEVLEEYVWVAKVRLAGTFHPFGS